MEKPIDSPRRVAAYSITGLFSLPSANGRGLLCWSGGVAQDSDIEWLKQHFVVFSMDNCYPNMDTYWHAREQVLDWVFTVFPQVSGATGPVPVHADGMYASRLVHPAIRRLDDTDAQWDLLVAHRADPAKNWELFIDQAHHLKGLRVLVQTQPPWSHAYDGSLARQIEDCALANGFEYRCEWLDTSGMNRLYNQARAIALFTKTSGDCRVVHDAAMTGCYPFVWAGTKSLLDFSALTPSIGRFNNMRDLANALRELPVRRFEPPPGLRESHHFFNANATLRQLAERHSGTAFHDWINRDSLRAFYYPHMDPEMKHLRAACAAAEVVE